MIHMKFRFILILIWIGCPFILWAQSITVTWQANTEPDLAGYHIYYGYSTRNHAYRLDVGNVTSYTFETFSDTGMIYLWMTAYDTTGNESRYSKEVTFYMVPPELQGEGFDLLPNHPNPFNPVTVIPYRIRETSHVKLAIYDVLGREVEVLVDEVKDRGQYNARWNGLHSRGGELANGMYFCRLIVGEFCHTRKLIYLK